MKSMNLALALAAGLAAMGAAPAPTMSGGNDGNPPAEGANGREMGRGPAEQLGLNPDQAKKFMDAIKAHREDLKPLHEAMKGLGRRWRGRSKRAPKTMKSRRLSRK